MTAMNEHHSQPTNSTNPRALVLCDGDIPGFHAAWAARERATANGPGSAMPLLVAFTSNPTGSVSESGSSGGEGGAGVGVEALEHAVTMQARALGLTAIASIHARGTNAEDLAGHRECIALTKACYAAAMLGCDRVIWPAHACVGESLDLDRIAQIADRSVLVARLVALDALAHRMPGIRIETPYVDLTDAQMADLFIDAELSASACWWWGGSESGEADKVGRRGQASSIAGQRAQQRWFDVLEPLGWHADA